MCVCDIGICEPLGMDCRPSSAYLATSVFSTSQCTRARPKAMSRSTGGARGPRGGGPDSACSCRPRSISSSTLQETGIEAAINDPDGPYDSARNRMMASNFQTQQSEMKVVAGQADYVVGSVHAITADGALVIASASGSQLAAYAWSAPNVILVAGTHKLVPSLQAAHERVAEHSLKLEDVRAQAAYGQHSYIGKLLEIRQELPGRIHLVLIRQLDPFDRATGVEIAAALEERDHRVNTPVRLRGDVSVVAKREDANGLRLLAGLDREALGGGGDV
jgi:hypothetical protein